MLTAAHGPYVLLQTFVTHASPRVLLQAAHSEIQFQDLRGPGIERPD